MLNDTDLAAGEPSPLCIFRRPVVRRGVRQALSSGEEYAYSMTDNNNSYRSNTS